VTNLLNQIRMLREIYPHNENILKVYGLACEQANKIAELEKDRDEVSPLLKRLLYCCDGLSTEYAQQNYGSANAWNRHIYSAYTRYQDAIDDTTT
jgi:hypothetical protein